MQTTLDNLFKKYKLIHYTCKECGYRYEGELSEEKEDYVCPECGASKEQFEAYDRLMARKIAGVRYQMEVYGSSTSTPYTFSKDIPIDVVVTIKEYSQQMPGHRNQGNHQPPLCGRLVGAARHRSGRLHHPGGIHGKQPGNFGKNQRAAPRLDRGAD